jgi:hypothetical protein
LAEKGLGKYFEAHHIIVQRLFKDPTVGKFLEEIGILKNSSKNVTVLPTPKGLRAGEYVGDAALHRGRHVGAYDKIVETPIVDLMDRFNAGQISKEQARKAVEQLQAQLRAKLQSGEIRLHHYDAAANREALAAAVNSYVALGVFAGLPPTEAQDAAFKEVEREMENESFYRQKNLIIRYGTAEYYASTSDSKAARWGAFAVDLINPVDDVRVVSDLAEDAIKGIKAWDPLETLSQDAGNKPAPAANAKPLSRNAVPKQLGWWDAVKSLIFD